jgi:hypothetical protein
MINTVLVLYWIFSAIAMALLVSRLMKNSYEMNTVTMIVLIYFAWLIFPILILMFLIKIIFS